jgi:hypothetical protein
MTTYTEVFGGTNIYPSDVSYLAFNLTSSDVVLAWPTETNAPNTVADYLAARIMNVNSTGSSRKVYLPEANQASVGECFLFNNVGSTTFTVVGSTGTTICSVASGELWQVYMTSNTTAAGVWSSYQFGSTTSQANAGALAGAGLKAITTTLNQAITVDDLNSNYTLGATERAHLINWTGASGTLSITAATTLGDDWFCYVRNSGSSSITIDPASSELINGSSTLTLTVGQSAMVVCDGVSFYTVGLSSSSTSSFDYTSINVAGTGDYTLAGAELNRIAYNFTGVLTGNRNIIVPTTIQQYWVTNSTTGTYDLEVKTSAGTGIVVPQGEAQILYCDGTNVVEGQTATGGIATPVAIADGGTGATTASGARVNLGGTSVGIGVFTAANTSDGQTALGATVTGQALFTAANAAAGRTTLGATTVGNGVFTAATQSDGQDALGGTTVGKAVFTAVDQAAAQAAIGVSGSGVSKAFAVVMGIGILS